MSFAVVVIFEVIVMDSAGQITARTYWTRNQDQAGMATSGEDYHRLSPSFCCTAGETEKPARFLFHWAGCRNFRSKNSILRAIHKTSRC